MSRGPAGHDHSQQHLTDVQTRRIVARAGPGYAAISWDYPGKTVLEVRIFRSLSRHAETAFDYEDAGADQTLVYYDVTGSFRDDALENGTPYYYTMFARHPGGMWVHWGNYELLPGEAATTVDGEAPSTAGSVASRLVGIVRRVLPAVAVLLCAGALLSTIPGDARGVPADVATAETDALVAVALADPAVADALGDVTYQTQCTKWQTVTVDKTPDPAVVTAHSAKGLRPGMNAFVARGEVIGAWVKGAKAPAFLAGVALKK